LLLSLEAVSTLKSDTCSKSLLYMVTPRCGSEPFLDHAKQTKKERAKELYK